jgi:hypothetical protein
LCNQELKIFSQQGLATGEPNFFCAQRHKNLCQTGDLFKTEQCLLRQIGVLRVKDLLGHAVAAAKIASVGDGNAQVPQRTRELVKHVLTQGLESRHQVGQRYGQGAGALINQRDYSVVHGFTFCTNLGRPVGLEGDRV